MTIDRANADALTVRDVRRSAEFHRDTIGLTLAELSDDFAYLKFGPERGLGRARVSAHGLAQ